MIVLVAVHGLLHDILFEGLLDIGENSPKPTMTVDTFTAFSNVCS